MEDKYLFIEGIKVLILYCIIKGDKKYIYNLASIVELGIYIIVYFYFNNWYQYYINHIIEGNGNNPIVTLILPSQLKTIDIIIRRIFDFVWLVCLLIHNCKRFSLNKPNALT